MSDRITARVQLSGGRWLACGTPALVLRADSAAGVHATLLDVERLTRDRGLHAVGLLAYEAGAAFGLRVHPLEDTGCPYAWFALYETGQVEACGPPDRASDYMLGVLEPRLSRADFGRAFERIKAHISEGDTYQVNYTFQMQAPFVGEPASLFADLVDAQRGQYSVYLDIGDLVFCSASPELFFEIDGLTIRARPMKGTAARGLTPATDLEARERLRDSAKDRAENVMVVDMVRNDLGRIAAVGSVEARDLFTVERYPNVWQMTSTVEARSAAPLAAIVRALHPSASITGAPKVRTMELIRELEGAPRGAYTGAMGYVAPDGSARFNVAIRTAVVSRSRATVSFGVGSGIVWDSSAEAEYDECLLKGSVLGRPPQPFDLLETLLWTGDRFWLLEHHLARLEASAGYFGIPVTVEAIRAALGSAVAGAKAARRVRLLVDRGGAVRVESGPHIPAPGPVTVRLAAEPVDAGSVWLYHKTTAREVYERARAATPGCDDVLLWNTRGELTEGTVTNVVVELDGERVTPPVSSGLLAGTCRAALLEAGQIREAVIPVSRLREATGLWVINSVQGERQAVLIS